MTVRFISGRGEGASLSARDEHYPNKRAAVQAIRSAGYRPGPKILERGAVVKLAYSWMDKSK